MRLKEVQLQKYRSIRNTGWFEAEKEKTILVGPNEAGKTAILRALQQINPPKEVAGFDPLRDYPRSEYNDISTGKVDPSSVLVVQAKFYLEEEDQRALPEAYKNCTYVFSRYLDNKWSHYIEGGPASLTYKTVKKNLIRLSAYVDSKIKIPKEGEPEPQKPSSKLELITKEWSDQTRISGPAAAKLTQWLNNILPLIDEQNSDEETRYDKIVGLIKTEENCDLALELLKKRMPVFVYFNNYFRVKPSIHLMHLARRLEEKILDDDQYDYGNECLLKLLGFTARELSDLGNVEEPKIDDVGALKKYRDQLDKRTYQLNAASVRLTREIRSVWVPEKSRDEADRLRVQVDRQYLKVIVEDDLGVEIELDQRSEGFQWLVSFFVVFFAEAIDKHKNAILLLDEPGLSLHGLKQREFRTTLSRLSTNNQIIFTTHSPFLVGPNELDLVRVVEMPNRKEGTIVHTTIAANDSASLLPLQEALGYDLAQSLFSQTRNLVLEGLTDHWYLDGTSHLLREAGIVELNEMIALITAGNAGKVVYFATILHAHKLKVAALLDSDAAGDLAAQQEVLIHKLGNKGILRTKDAYTGRVMNPEIEDLLRQTLIKVAKADLEWDVEAVANSQPSRPIVDIFQDTISNFSKYKLAKAYLRWTRTSKGTELTTDEQTQWVKLINNINKVLK